MRLSENAGIAFQGCIVLGMGFVVDVAEAQEWIAADARNAEVLFPYLNGEDLNQRPDASASRWVIDFNDRSESAASRYGLPFARVTRQVKAERMANNRKVYRDYWWQYAEKRPAMRKAIAGLPEVLVIARVSKTVMPLRVPTGQVFQREAGRVRHRFVRDSGHPVLECSSIVGYQVRHDHANRRQHIHQTLFSSSLPRPPPNQRLAQSAELSMRNAARSCSVSVSG